MHQNSKTLPANQRKDQVSRLLKKEKSAVTMLGTENVTAVTVPPENQYQQKYRENLLRFQGKTMQ